MCDNDLSPEIKSILKEIKFISSCPKGKKLSFSLRKYTDSGVWSVDGFRKMLLFETHTTVLHKIEQVLEEVKACLSNKETQTKPIMSLFETYLEEMQTGLENLKETYADDPDASSYLYVIIDQLKLLISNIHSKIGNK